MQYENDFLTWLRRNPAVQLLFGDRIFFGLAPAATANPFMTLQDISPNSNREIATAKPRMQIDCFATDQFEAAMLAEKLVLEIQFCSFTSGDTYFQSVRAERVQGMRVEDGSWKVPVDIRFSCRRN